MLFEVYLGDASFLPHSFMLSQTCTIIFRSAQLRDHMSEYCILSKVARPLSRNSNTTLLKTVTFNSDNGRYAMITSLNDIFILSSASIQFELGTSLVHDRLLLVQP